MRTCVYVRVKFVEVVRKTSLRSYSATVTTTPFAFVRIENRYTPSAIVNNEYM